MSSVTPATDSRAPAAPGTPPKTIELTPNESWLLIHAMKHHKNGGLVTSDVDWDAVVAEEGCVYKNTASIKVTFNNLKRKMGWGGKPGAGAGAGAGATIGSSNPSTPKTPKTPKTPNKTPRKAKTTCSGSEKKVTKRTPRKSSINVNGLAAVAQEQADASPVNMPKGGDVDSENELAASKSFKDSIDEAMANATEKSMKVDA